MTEDAAEQTFRIFNLAEGIFWIVLGAGFFVTAGVRRRNVDLMSVTGLLFLAFGLSDFVEIQTGGWYKPWWMLTWKAANLAGLVGMYLLFRRRAWRECPDIVEKAEKEAPSRRLDQALLIGSSIVFSWLGMMVVHEFGHVLHLWLSGGRVDYVVLHPLTISYTHPAANPHPLFVAWGGAIWGCAVPLAAVVLVGRVAPSHVYLARFFAGFAVVVNGAYLAGDALLRGGDGRELVGYGTPPWLLIAIGISLIALGLWLWNGLGPSFGLGAAKGRVDRRAALGAAAGTALLIAAEVLLS